MIALVNLPDIVNPTMHVPPLGLASLAARLKQSQLPVKIVDLGGSIRYNLMPSFVSLTSQDRFVAEIPDLPLICNVMQKYLDGADVASILAFDSTDRIWARYASRRNIALAEMVEDLKRVHEFVQAQIPTLLIYDVLGFSSYYSNFYLLTLFAALLKRHKPNTRIVVGGPQVSQSKASTELLLRSRLADAIVVGEGEEPLNELMQAAQDGQNWNGIAGVYTQDGLYQPRPAIPVLDSLPIPDYTDFDFSFYNDFQLPHYTSRGCVFRCAFCSEHSMLGQFRQRSPDHVVADMHDLQSRYRTVLFSFQDSLLNASPHWLSDFCDSILRSDMQAQWGGYQRAKVDEHLAKHMHAAGLYHVTVGTDSLVDSVLEKMHKNRTVQENLNAVNCFIENGIAVSLNLIVGYPGEDEADFEQTLELATDLCNRHRRDEKAQPVFVLDFQPFAVRAASIIHEQPEAFGISYTYWSLDDLPPLDPVLAKIALTVPETFFSHNLAAVQVFHRLKAIEKIAAATQSVHFGFNPRCEKDLSDLLQQQDRFVLKKRPRLRHLRDETNKSTKLIAYLAPHRAITLSEKGIFLLNLLEEEMTLEKLARTMNQAEGNSTDQEALKQLLSVLIFYGIVELSPAAVKLDGENEFTQP